MDALKPSTPLYRSDGAERWRERPNDGTTDEGGYRNKIGFWLGLAGVWPVRWWFFGVRQRTGVGNHNMFFFPGFLVFFGCCSLFLPSLCSFDLILIVLCSLLLPSFCLAACGLSFSLFRPSTSQPDIGLRWVLVRAPEKIA